MKELTEENIVWHPFEDKYGRIKEVSWDGYVIVDWFNDDNDNPLTFGEIQLFCDGKQKAICNTCNLRFNCYTT